MRARMSGLPRIDSRSATERPCNRMFEQKINGASCRTTGEHHRKKVHLGKYGACSFSFAFLSAR